MKKISAIIFLLSVSIATAFSQDGKKLPSVMVTNMNGEKVDLNSLTGNGKIVVVDFWATWCIPCKKELTNIAEMYGDWKKNYNVEFIAVSIDDARNTAKVKTTVDGAGWEYTIMLDPNQEMMHALNFQAPPYMLIIDKEGNIAETHSGYVDGDEFLVEEKLKELAAK